VKHIKNLVKIFHDGWVILGLTLLLVVSLEILYRIEATADEWLRVRIEARSSEGAVHPYHNLKWWPEFKQALQAFPKSAGDGTTQRGLPDEDHPRQAFFFD
jgi:hypothetical protein